jgi:hypothetical protein
VGLGTGETLGSRAKRKSRLSRRLWGQPRCALLRRRQSVDGPVPGAPQRGPALTLRWQHALTIALGSATVKIEMGVHRPMGVNRMRLVQRGPRIRSRRSCRRRLCALSILGAVLSLGTNAALSSAVPTPRGLHHCGLIQGGQWQQPPLRGNFFQVAELHMQCRGRNGAGALALLASHRGLPRRRGFRCNYFENGGGLCFLGNIVHPTARTKEFSFIAELRCAEPDPPFTEYSALPSWCTSTI